MSSQPVQSALQRPSRLAGIFEPIRLIWTHRQILLATTRTDVRQKFAGSALGLGWFVLYPMLLLAAYAAVYIYIFNVRLGLFDSNEYVLLIFCGLVPFLAFAEALALGTVSVTGNASLVKNTLFRIELIPVKAVLTTQVTQAVSLTLLITALAILGLLQPAAVFALLIWACQLTMTIGLVWILSAVNVFLRDVQHSLGVVVLLLMMISPIAYTEDMVSPLLQSVLKFNPLYYVIICYQECLMFGRVPRAGLLIPLLTMSGVLFFGGYMVFRRLKPIFSDHI